MGNCWSCGGGAHGVSEPGTEYVIKFTDGSTSNPYPDKPSARVALYKSKKTGTIVPK